MEIDQKKAHLLHLIKDFLATLLVGGEAADIKISKSHALAGSTVDSGRNLRVLVSSSKCL